jgi:ADP-heptose:LPS heptosyltransferase
LPIKIHVVSEALLSYSNSKTSKLSRAVRVEERKLEAQIRKGAYTVTVDLTARQGVDVQRWVEYVQPQYRLGWRNPQSTDSHSIFGLSDARLMADRHWTKVNALPFSFFGTLDLEHEEMLACKSSPALERKAQGRWNTGKRILLIPGSRSEVKRWSLASFTEVARLLARKQDCSIMISGGPSERDLVTSLARALPKGTATYTGRDIGFLFALIRSADLVITNDTGPMHVAFLCCVPTLAFFTYMNPLVWGPLHTGERSCVFDQRSKNIDDTLNTEVVDASLRLLALSTA